MITRDRMARIGLVVLLAQVFLVSPPALGQITEDDFVAKISSALGSENVQVRRDAAQELKTSAHLVDERLLALMAKVLEEDRDAQVRLSVMDAATILNKKASSLVPPLLDSIRKDSGSRGNERLHQDYRAAFALASIGKPAVTGLTDLLSFEKANVRAEAAMALGRIGGDAAPAIPELIRLFSDENERVRLESTKAVAAIGPTAIERLLEILRHGDDRQKSCALRALGVLPVTIPEGIELMESSTTSADTNVRAAAIAACGRVSEPAVFRKILQENLSHESDGVRREVTNQFLSRANWLDEAKPQLVQLLAHEEDGVALNAAFLLQNIGPSAAEEMIQSFGNESTRLSGVAESIAMFGPSVLERLLEGMKDKRSRVREGCSLALGSLRPMPTRASEALVSGLQDASPGVQKACLVALGRQGTRAIHASTQIEALLSSTDASVRATAVSVLFQVAGRNDQSIQRVSSLIQDDAESVQLAVIEALHGAGPSARQSLPAILPKLDGPSRDVQMAVLAFITSHGKGVQEAVPYLIRYLKRVSDLDLKVRSLQAIAQVGKGAVAAKDELIAVMDADESQLRIGAVDALSNLELSLDESRPFLVKAFQDSHEEVRRKAMRAIRRFGQDSRLFLPELISLVKPDEKDDSYVLRDIQRMEKHGLARETVPKLAGFLASTNPKQITLAAKFLAMASAPLDDSVVKQLESLAEHENDSVRTAIASALDKIKNMAVEPALIGR